eukprot:TRINITY_DN40084_c0_g1_i1.p1 TRINITY_DN40084_c0_g1~~TRINITY_DN40084_c0_g1_i1.p1  ORF type:complete len:484 (+),score=45.74 TRINITY_DN40084_c0_g1_i1:97-1548(+)
MFGHMIETWGARTFRVTQGSVLPKAARVAFLASLLSASMSVATDYFGIAILPNRNVHLGELWTSFASVTGFLLVFRTNQAYNRYWEGITLVHQIRGEWFHAVSSIITFCNPDPDKAREVSEFQHKLVRLASVLFCCALQQVCDLEDDALEVMNTSDLDPDGLNYLFTFCNDRCEILLHWIQRHILDASRSEVLDVAAPILTRPFQELSRGMVSLIDVRKLKEFPFPFPFDQLILLLLCLQWVATALLASASTDTPWAAAGATFVITLAYWSLCYIATEIEQPFGDDYNDINLEQLQIDFNSSLQLLLNPRTTTPPAFTFDWTKAQASRLSVVETERLGSSGVVTETCVRQLGHIEKMKRTCRGTMRKTTVTMRSTITSESSSCEGRLLSKKSQGSEATNDSGPRLFVNAEPEVHVAQRSYCGDQCGAMADSRKIEVKGPANFGAAEPSPGYLGRGTDECQEVHERTCGMDSRENVHAEPHVII